MIESFIYIFAVIGVCLSFGIFCFIFVLAVDGIREYIRCKKYDYKRKHRFDKPPTAKCYCKDCVYRDVEIGTCSKGTINHSYDAWFCADATPCRHDPDIKKKGE